MSTERPIVTYLRCHECGMDRTVTEVIRFGCGDYICLFCLLDGSTNDGAKTCQVCKRGEVRGKEIRPE